jgi:hypothetical protein
MEIANTSFTNSDIILYDFINDQTNYTCKAKPTLIEMYEIGLIDSMIECIESQSFTNILEKFNLTESEFNQYDIDLITPCKYLLIKIRDDFENITLILDQLSSSEFLLLPVIIAKRYIYNKQRIDVGKVSCNITTIIGSRVFELVVNCYNFSNKGRKTFKSVKGNIDTNDADIATAISREIKEEINLTILPHLFKSCEIKKVYGKPMYQFKMQVDSNTIMCRPYSSTDLDLEITCIKLREVKIEETPLQKANAKIEKIQNQLLELTNEMANIRILLNTSC